MYGQRDVDHGAWAKGREGGQERGGEGWGWDTPPPPQATAPPSLGAEPVSSRGSVSTPLAPPPSSLMAPPLGPPMSSAAPPLGPPPTAKPPPTSTGQAGTQAPSFPAYLARNMTGAASSATLRSRPTPNVFLPKAPTTAAQPPQSMYLLPDLPNLLYPTTSSSSLADSMEPEPPRARSPKELQALLEMGPKETAQYERYVARASRASRGSNASPPPPTHTASNGSMASPPHTTQQQPRYAEEMQPQAAAPSMPLSPPRTTARGPMDLPPPPTTAQLATTPVPPPTMAQLQSPLPPPPTSAQLQAQQRMASPPSVVLPHAEAKPSTAPPTHQAGPPTPLGQVPLDTLLHPQSRRELEEDEEECDQFGRPKVRKPAVEPSSLPPTVEPPPPQQVASQQRESRVPSPVPQAFGFHTCDVAGAIEDPEGGSTPSSPILHTMAPSPPLAPPPLSSMVMPEPSMSTAPVEGVVVSPPRLLSVAPQCLTPLPPTHDDPIEASTLLAISNVCPPSHGPRIDEPSHGTADVSAPPLHVAGHNSYGPAMQTDPLHNEGHGIGHSRKNASLDVTLEAHSVSNSNSNGHGVNGQMGPMCEKMEQAPMVEAPVDPRLRIHDADYAKMLLETFDLPVKQIASVYEWQHEWIPKWSQWCRPQEGLLWKLVQAAGRHKGMMRGKGLKDERSIEFKAYTILKEMAAHTNGDQTEVSDACEELMRLLDARPQGCGDVDMAMVAYGDQLRGRQWVHMAHAAYLLAGMEPGTDLARAKGFEVIGVDRAYFDILAASRGCVLASYLRMEILVHLRANACAKKTRVPLPKYPAEWLLTLRLTMIYSLLEEKHAEDAEDLFRSLHEKLDGYITLPSAVHVMQGYTGYTPKMLWPYSHEMARSYNGAWLGIVHQLGERTHALPVDYCTLLTTLGHQLDLCHANVHPNRNINVHHSHNVTPNLSHTPLGSTSAGHQHAPPSPHQEALQSGPPPPSSARTPSPRLTEQRPTSPDWASAGQDHGVSPTPTPLTAPPMGVATIQATGHLSPRALAGGSIAGGRVASPIFPSTVAVPPPTTRASHMGGVESVGTLSPIPSPRGPITHATQEEVVPPPALAQPAYNRQVAAPKGEPSMWAKALVSVVVNVARVAGWFPPEAKQADLGMENKMFFCKVRQRWIDPNAPVEEQEAEDPGSRPPPIFKVPVQVPETEAEKKQEDASPPRPSTAPLPATDAFSLLMAPPAARGLPRRPTSTTPTVVPPPPKYAVFLPTAKPAAAT